jgi:hypothetical protein
VNLLLDVNGHDGHGEVGAVLFVLTLPDQLRVERRVARVEDGPGPLLVLGDEVAQLLRGDVLALVLVADGVDFGLGRFFWPWVDSSGLGRAVRADNANELVREATNGGNGVVDSLREAVGIIIIARAGNDAGMERATSVEAPLMPVIVRYNRPGVRGGVGKHIGIVGALPPCFLYGQHIVPQVAQRFHRGQWEVLIGVKPCHDLTVLR